jgi:hypothetical protein
MVMPQRVNCRLLDLKLDFLKQRERLNTLNDVFWQRRESQNDVALEIDREDRLQDLCHSALLKLKTLLALLVVNPEQLREAL